MLVPFIYGALVEILEVEKFNRCGLKPDAAIFGPGGFVESVGLLLGCDELLE